MPSDPGRLFTQQPSKLHCVIFTFPKKYWERKDEIISGQKRMQITGHFTVVLYSLFGGRYAGIRLKNETYPQRFGAFTFPNRRL